MFRNQFGKRGDFGGSCVLENKLYRCDLWAAEWKELPWRGYLSTEFDWKEVIFSIALHPHAFWDPASARPLSTQTINTSIMPFKNKTIKKRKPWTRQWPIKWKAEEEKGKLKATYRLLGGLLGWDSRHLPVAIRSCCLKYCWRYLQVIHRWTEGSLAGIHRDKHRGTTNRRHGRAAVCAAVREPDSQECPEHILRDSHNYSSCTQGCWMWLPAYVWRALLNGECGKEFQFSPPLGQL